MEAVAKMETTALPNAVTNDQVFLKANAEKLDQLIAAVLEMNTALAGLMATLTNASQPIINVSFDPAKIAQALHDAQTEKQPTTTAKGKQSK